MEDTLITVLGIVLAIILLFIFPLTEIAGKSDELSETVVQLTTNDFVNQVAIARKNNGTGLYHSCTKITCNREYLQHKYRS